MPKGKKQLGKLSKRQQGANFSQQMIGILQNVAADFHGILNKGVITDPLDPKKKIDLPCAVADVKAGFTPEQLGGMEEFVSDWYVEPQPK